MKKRAKKTTRKLTEEQRLAMQKKRQDAAFKKKIRTTLSDSGFNYIPTADKHFVIEVVKSLKCSKMQCAIIQ